MGMIDDLELSKFEKFIDRFVLPWFIIFAFIYSLIVFFVEIIK